ncbi:MAG: hypothetical protein D4R97_05475 [Bacteroidetes bacterium]|nr:MAG: hypothetical protein D4R97_05475 [Bacteroidota bacterium]
MNGETVSQPDLFSQPPYFAGSDYQPEIDDKRLTGQLLRIFDCMKDGKWRTLSEISEITGDHEASISAQLRHLRKKQFGSHTVNKRRRGERECGLFEYQLILNSNSIYSTIITH